MCENGTSCNILLLSLGPRLRGQPIYMLSDPSAGVVGYVVYRRYTGHRASPSTCAYLARTSAEVLFLWHLYRIGRVLMGYHLFEKNPEGVSRCINPSFPLKGSVSEPEGEAWEARLPKPHYPEGVAYTRWRVDIIVKRG